MKRTIAVLILAMVMAAPVAALATEEPTVCAQADRTEINIGDRIKFTVTAAADAKTDIEFPKFKDNKIGDFEIKDSGKKERRSIFGKRVRTHWYHITIYATGKQTIPSVEVKFTAKGAKGASAKKTLPIHMIVESLLPKEVRRLDIKDIKGPLAPYSPNWLVMTIILAAIILVISGVLIYRRLKAGKPVKLPHETALEELEEIRGIFAKTGDIKEYFVRISDCVRLYIERRFRLRAPEMTTEEFLESIKDSHALKFEHRDLLKKFMASCDLVKFAKHSPPTEEMEAVYVAAKTLVEETKEISKEIEKAK
jgi:hypothetical protein